MADWIEQLERLSQLHRAGALTDEEFAAQKARVLAAANTPAAAEPAVPAAEPEPVPAAWDGDYAEEEPDRRNAVKWALLALPVAAVLAGAAWFGSTLVGRKSDPELAGGAIATPAASDAAMASAAPSEDAALPAALDETLAFAVPTECEAGPTLDKLYTKLDSAVEAGSGKGYTVRLDAFTDPLAVEVKNGTSADGLATHHAWVRFPANATWHGLKLSRVTSTDTVVPESDAGAYERSLTFLDEPDKVRSTLGRLGFAAPRAPETRELGGEGCTGTIQVQAISGGSALVCGWSC